jgi:hypothetical protein
MLIGIQRKLKALKFKSPYDKMIGLYDENPSYFKSNPIHKKLGLNA